MEKRIFFILFIVMFTASSCSERSSIKVSITGDSSDVDLFYSMLDAARENNIEIDEDYLYDNYVSKGSPGLRSIFNSVEKYAERKNLDAKEEYFKNIQSHLKFLEVNREEIIRNKSLFEEAVLLKISKKLESFLNEDFTSTFYFLIGDGTMYGTAFDEGVVIDVSMTKNENIDYSVYQHPDFAKYFVTKEDSLFVFVHEVMHQLQEIPLKKEGIENPNKDMGDLILAEGGAHFFAKVLLEEKDIPSFYKNQENHFKNNPQLMKEIIDDKDIEMENRDFVDKWFYNFLEVAEGTPPDMGYYLGSVITEDYYDRAEDKKEAFNKIIKYWENKEEILNQYAQNNL